jgi:predicted nucleic acid-binding protein
MAEPKTPAFIDTSVVVRYLTDDPPALAERAARLLEGEEPLILSELVLVEAAYVLTKVYEVSREATVDALVELVQRHNLALLDVPKPLAIEALRLCRGSGRVSFADAFLWAQARQAGADTVYTFDARFPTQGLARAFMP